MTKLSNIMFQPEDFRKAGDFLQRLGMSLTFADGERWAQYHLAGSGFALASAGEFPHGHTGALPVLQVTDLETLLLRLDTEETWISPIRDMGDHGRTVTISDSCGITMQLFEKAHGPTPPGQ